MDTQPKSLLATLTDANLAQYEEALHELGCTATEHLCDLEEEDMVGIGMKKMGEWPSNDAAVAAAAVAAAAPADAAAATTVLLMLTTFLPMLTLLQHRMQAPDASRGGSSADSVNHSKPSPPHS